MNTLPIVFAIVAAVVTYFLGVMLIPKKLTNDTTSFMRKRIKDIESSDLGLAYEVESDIMRDRFQSTSPLAKFYYAMPFGKYSHQYLISGGMSSSVDKFAVVCLAIFFASMLFLSFSKITLNPLFIVLAAVVITYFAAWRIIVRKIKLRIRAFINQFPDALDIIVRSVKSGFPLNAAVNMVAETMPSPTSEEFRQLSTEVAHGSTMVDALDRLGKRMRNPDIRFFVVVLTLQQEVGGSLAEVLSNLSLLIRKRKMMKKKIYAITSEGRFTGWVLGALPILVALAIHTMNPEYMLPLFYTPSGHTIMMMVAGTIATGVFIIRKMVDIEV